MPRRIPVFRPGTPAAAAGAAVAVPAIRRFSSRPVLRTVSFDSVTVDGKGARVATDRHTAQMFTETLGFGGSLDLVLVPGGSFTMGSPATDPERKRNEWPQHHVMLEPFFIGAAPVTQAQWKAVVMAHPAPLQRDLDPSLSLL